MQVNKKRLNNHIGEHCDMLVQDFFNFCDGNPDKVKLIDIRDIKEVMPPEKWQIKVAYMRCYDAWVKYCALAKLSNMQKRIFKQRVEKIWHQKELAAREARLKEMKPFAIG